MTEVHTEQVAAPEAAPATSPPDQPSPPPTATSAGPAAAVVEHTPGGIPVLPLALAGANTTVSAVAAAVVVAGPMAAVLAAAGAGTVGAIAAVRSRRGSSAAHRARRMSGKPTAGHRGSAATMTRASRVPKQQRRPTAGSGGTSTASRLRCRGKGMTGKNTASRNPMAGATGRRPTAGSGKATGRRVGVGKGGGSSRLGAVTALRAAQRQATPTRRAARMQQQAARRAVADARRTGRTTQSATRPGAKRRFGGLLGKSLSKARRVRDAAIGRRRAAHDQRVGDQVAVKRRAVRRAPARRRARSRLWRSAARMQARRALAAPLGGMAGVLGLASTPLGRKLRASWLMYPGRRLYRRLIGAAKAQRAERDAAIRADQAAEEAAVEAAAEQSDDDGIGERAQRPTHLVPTTTTPAAGGEGESSVSGFNFEEAAAEMESQATTYEPDGCMEILAMVEKLPEALTSVANTLRILAERADGEFALEKEVAGGFNDVFQALMNAVSAAEDLGPVFRKVHEQDIARHEDPRNGPQAEKGWNV